MSENIRSLLAQIEGEERERGIEAVRAWANSRRKADEDRERGFKAGQAYADGIDDADEVLFLRDLVTKAAGDIYDAVRVLRYCCGDLYPSNEELYNASFMEGWFDGAMDVYEAAVS